MKSLGRIRLTQLNKDELEKRELKELIGGNCYCSCTSSITYNSLFNYRGGLHNGNPDKYWDESGNPCG